MAQISVIVPVYKVPKSSLKKCIESIISQTLSDIEIVLVDDGSPDDCGAICDFYRKKDYRVKVIHKKNGGLSSARNAGVKAATSKWIMFVDGDDWIDSAMCEVMYKYAEANSVQLIMCGMVKEYKRASEKYKYYLEDGKIYIGDECRWLQEQVLHFNSNIATACCKLILRDFLMTYNIFHDKLLKQGAEGIEFNLRLFEKINRAMFLNIPFYHYTYDENSISASHNEENHMLVLRCFEKIRDYIDKSDNRERLNPWLYNRLLYVIITTAISGYFSVANKEPYKIKKEKYISYLGIPIVKEAMIEYNLEDMSKERKIVLFLIRRRLFLALDILGKLRSLQKRCK